MYKKWLILSTACIGAFIAFNLDNPAVGIISGTLVVNSLLFMSLSRDKKKVSKKYEYKKASKYRGFLLFKLFF